MNLALNPSSYSTPLTVSLGRASIPLVFWRPLLSNPGALSKVRPLCLHSLIHKTKLKEMKLSSLKSSSTLINSKQNSLKFTRQSWSAVKPLQTRSHSKFNKNKLKHNWIPAEFLFQGWSCCRCASKDKWLRSLQSRPLPWRWKDFFSIIPLAQGPRCHRSI